MPRGKETLKRDQSRRKAQKATFVRAIAERHRSLSEDRRRPFRDDPADGANRCCHRIARRMAIEVIHS
jgi:hypothetical protein